MCWSWRFWRVGARGRGYSDSGGASTAGSSGSSSYRTHTRTVRCGRGSAPDDREIRQNRFADSGLARDVPDDLFGAEELAIQRDAVGLPRAGGDARERG